jgi:uncharacterized protein YuzE
MQVSYDTEADALYVRFREAHGVLRTETVDDFRMIDRDDEGVVGVELHQVSRGLDLAGLPEAEEIARAIRSMPQPA